MNLNTLMAYSALRAEAGDEVISSRANGKVKLARPHVWKKA